MLDAADRPHISYVDIGRFALQYLFNDGTGWRLDIVHAPTEPPEALVEAARHAAVLVVADGGLGAECLASLRTIRSACPDLPIILVGQNCQVEVALEALQLGLVDYLSRPINQAKLRERVDEAVERRACLAELSARRAWQSSN